jgi:hypothetical protein
MYPDRRGSDLFIPKAESECWSVPVVVSRLVSVLGGVSLGGPVLAGLLPF